MAGSEDEEILLRVQLRNQVSGPAAEAEVSVNRFGESARNQARNVEELQRATDRYRRSLEELALAEEIERAASNSSARERLAASRSVAGAQDRVQRDQTRMNTLLREEQRIRTDLDRTGQSETRTWRQRGLQIIQNIAQNEKLNKGLDKVSSKLFTLRNLLKLVKFEAILGGVRLLFTAVGALGVAIVALIAGMAPLAGLLAAYPGLAISAALGMGVLKAAFSGFGKTLSDMNGNDWEAVQQDMAKLSPQAALAANSLHGFLQNAWHPLQQAMQNNVFAGVNSNIGAFAGILQSVQPELLAASRAVGGLIADAERLARSPMFQRDLATNVSTFTKLLTQMGHAGLYILDAFNHVLVLLQPFFTWLGHVLVQGAKMFDNWVHSAKGAQDITSFFAATERTASTAWKVVKNFLVGFVNILRLATPTVHMMSSGILGLSQRFKAWTQSANGQNEIAGYFTKANLTLHALGKLLSDIAKLFGHLADNPDMADFINLIDRQIIPALARLLGTGGNSELTKAIVGLVKNVINLAAVINQNGGTITDMVKIVSALVYWFSKLPHWLQSATFWFLAIYKVMKELQIIQKIAFLFDLLAGSETAAAVAAWALDAVPIVALFVAIGVAIALLIVGIGWLVEHWKAMWDMIKQAAYFAWNHGLSQIFNVWAVQIKFVWHLAVGAFHLIQKAWNDLSSGFSGAWNNYIKPIFNRVVQIVKDAIKWFKDAIHLAHEFEQLYTRTETTSGHGTLAPGVHPNAAGNSNNLPAQSGLQSSLGTAPGNTTSNKPKVQPRWAGGPVLPNKVYLVGEKGPEWYSSTNGNDRLVGMNGPEYATFPDLGKIIPNNALKSDEALTSTYNRDREAMTGSGPKMNPTTMKQDITVEGDDIKYEISGLGLSKEEVLAVLEERDRKRQLDKGRKIHSVLEKRP